MATIDPDAFTLFGMQPVDNATADERFAAAGLTCVFLWGDDCFNCDIAKKHMVSHQARIAALPMRWLHANAYRDVGLRDRFALHGVPAFFFYRDGRKLGRITGWPGIDAFCRAVDGLVVSASADSS